MDWYNGRPPLFFLRGGGWGEKTERLVVRLVWPKKSGDFCFVFLQAKFWVRWEDRDETSSHETFPAKSNQDFLDLVMSLNMQNERILTRTC